MSICSRRSSAPQPAFISSTGHSGRRAPRRTTDTFIGPQIDPLNHPQVCDWRVGFRWNNSRAHVLLLCASELERGKKHGTPATSVAGVYSFMGPVELNPPGPPAPNLLDPSSTARAAVWRRLRDPVRFAELPTRLPPAPLTVFTTFMPIQAGRRARPGYGGCVLRFFGTEAWNPGNFGCRGFLVSGLGACAA